MLRAVGSIVIGRVEAFNRLVYTLVGALASPVLSRGQGRGVVGRVTLMQILFTGFQALPLVSVVALLLGGALVMNLILAVPEISDQLGKIMAVLIVREVSPMATAVIVVGRSGTAIATELGGMQVRNEVRALQSMGINPLHYLVLPRFVGVVVAVVCLLIYFNLAAILGGYLGSWLLLGPEREVLLDAMVSALGPASVILFLVKGLGMGLVVAWLCCHYGLEVGESPTQVPQMASRAVVASLVSCFVLSLLTSVVFYLATG
jgi:phospholipid/cholesterol/gamma-HCH transport system permease protein